MINKRHELVVRNLHSIMSEVRLRSVEQIENLPGMPLADRIKHLESIKDDAEDSVRNAVLAALGRLKGNMPSAGVTPLAPAKPMVSQPVQQVEEPAKEVITTSPNIPNYTSSPKPMGVNSLNNLNPISSRTISPVEKNTGIAASPIQKQNITPVSSPAQYSESFNKPVYQQNNGLKSPQSIVVGANDQSNTKRNYAEALNETKDPSLEDISKKNDVGWLLDYIKQISASRPSGYLSQLIELSTGYMEEVALTALQALFNSREEKIAPVILDMLSSSDFSSQRRFLMLKIILDTDAELDCSKLESILLKEKDVIVKSGLVKVFARNAGTEGIGTLVKCLSDSDPRVRANTVEVIEEQNIKGCEANIIPLLNDSENRVKVNAAKFLVKSGYAQAFYTLRAMLASQEVWLRDSVIFALGEIGDQNCLMLLRAAMKDPNQGIRLSVLKALAHINSKNARLVLQAACGDPDQVVAQVANSLFEKIKNTPPKPENVLKFNNIPAAQAKPVQNSVKAPVENKTVNTSVPLQQPQAQVNIPVNNNQNVNMPPQRQVNIPQTPQINTVNKSSGGVSLPDISSILPNMTQNNIQKPVVSAPRPPLTVPILSRPINNNIGVPRQPASATPLPTIPTKVNTPQSNLPTNNVSDGNMPNFEKPRSKEIFGRLCSDNNDIRNSAVRDIAFVMGNDQIILVKHALTISDESIRIAAVKILTRKRTPEAKALLMQCVQDSNETIRSLAQKAISMLN